MASAPISWRAHHTRRTPRRRGRSQETIEIRGNTTKCASLAAEPARTLERAATKPTSVLRRTSEHTRPENVMLAHSRIGEPVLRDIYGAMHAAGASGAVVVATGTVSKKARAWVTGKQIRIIQLPELQRLIDEAAAGPSTGAIS